MRCTDKNQFGKTIRKGTIREAQFDFELDRGVLPTAILRTRDHPCKPWNSESALEWAEYGLGLGLNQAIEYSGRFGDFEP